MNLLKKIFLQINTRTIYLYSFFIGIITGLVSTVFYKLIFICTRFTHETLSHMPMTEPEALSSNNSLFDTPRHFIFFLLPIVGGLLAGFCTHYLAPETGGSGTETFLDAFHHKAGFLRKRTGFVKMLASLFTLSSGGSGGKEGPMTLIGASMGSIFGKFIKMGARAQRTLLLAGAAGGLGSIFRTPLGGAITAVEVLYKEDFESDALIPCIISSVTAYTVFGAFLGYGPVLKFSSAIFHSPLELVFYVVLASVCTLFAFLFVKIYGNIGSCFFAKLPIHPKYLPAIGGIMVACVGYFLPETLGGGLGIIQQAINGTYSKTWILTGGFFLLLALFKMFTTSFTVQSKGSAGLLVPSFFIGGMLGGCVGTVFHHFFPESVPSVTPFIVVGMASFFAAVTNASLGALVMVTELTGGYQLLPPLMVVCVISLIFSHKWSIYKNQMANKFHSKAHLWDMNPVILKSTKISSSFDSYKQKAIIHHSSSLQNIQTQARLMHESDFVVQNDQNQLMGVLSLKDLEFDEKDASPLNDILVAEDMLRRETYHITPEDSLLKAINLLSNADFDKLPVIEDDKNRKLLGYITRKDILKYYNQLGNCIT